MKKQRIEKRRIPANLEEIVCSTCKGKGQIPIYETCRNCHGTGEVGPFTQRFDDDAAQGSICRYCDSEPEGIEHRCGQCYRGQETCTICRGHGHYYLEPEKPKETTEGPKPAA
ncbi:MAG: hypothetical protein WC551_06290 [Patescibacteria group bacterium]